MWDAEGHDTGTEHWPEQEQERLNSILQKHTLQNLTHPSENGRILFMRKQEDDSRWDLQALKYQISRKKNPLEKKTWILVA